MFLIGANHAHDAAPPDDLALVANPFDRCPNFHNYLSVVSDQWPANFVIRPLITGY
jgi:hypothetical protein